MNIWIIFSIVSIVLCVAYIFYENRRNKTVTTYVNNIKVFRKGMIIAAGITKDGNNLQHYKVIKIDYVNNKIALRKVR